MRQEQPVTQRSNLKMVDRGVFDGVPDILPTHGCKTWYGHHGHGHFCNSIWPLDAATDGHKSAKSGIVGHLAMPTIPLILRA